MGSRKCLVVEVLSTPLQLLSSLNESKVARISLRSIAAQFQDSVGRATPEFERDVGAEARVWKLFAVVPIMLLSGPK